LEENARFCQKCGKPVAVFVPPPPPQPPAARHMRNDSALIIAVALVAVLVIALIVVAVFFLIPANFNSSNQGNVNQISWGLQSVHARLT
jgi:heme/copper-type cytochrome/quinol oxidase subunit 2